MTRLEALGRRHAIDTPLTSEAFAMSISSSVRVPTAHASRYLQQLCKH